MSKINKIAFVLILVSGILFSCIPALAQTEIPKDIITSLETGNSKVLANYFNENVELVVLDKDNVYSKAQARQIVNNFFRSNTPESFNVIHQGGKEAKYVIGNLKTNNGTFRIYFLLKKNNSKDYIHQLRIEKQ
jgi:hypothetical protein